METYFANQPLPISVTLVTSAGVSVTDPSNVMYRVLDGLGAEITPQTPVDVTAGTGLADIDMDETSNQLGVGEVRAYRQIEVSFFADGKSYMVFEEYLIESMDALVPTVNSFQTYASAMLLTGEITGIDTLMGSTRRERIAALINSYNVISRLRFNLSSHSQCRLYGPNQVAAPGWGSNGIVNFRSLNAEQFALLPKSLLNAVQTAQVIEANEALDNFSILKKRQQGLMSETIGESSMMFRPEKVLNVPVTRRSLDMLRPYLVWELSVGRG